MQFFIWESWSNQHILYCAVKISDLPNKSYLLDDSITCTLWWESNCYTTSDINQSLSWQLISHPFIYSTVCRRLILWKHDPEEKSGPYMLYAVQNHLQKGISEQDRLKTILNTFLLGSINRAPLKIGCLCPGLASGRLQVWPCWEEARSHPVPVHNWWHLWENICKKWQKMPNGERRRWGGKGKKQQRESKVRGGGAPWCSLWETHTRGEERCEKKGMTERKHCVLLVIPQHPSCPACSLPEGTWTEHNLQWQQGRRKEVKLSLGKQGGKLFF